MNNKFWSELEQLINRYSIEQHSNTPDFLLTQYIESCLRTWNSVTNARDSWYKDNLKDLDNV